MTQPTVERPQSLLDLTDPAVNRDPFPHLGVVQEQSAAVWNPPSDSWLITSFDDVKSVFMNFSDFAQAEQMHHDIFNGTTMVGVDNPRHNELRSILGPPLSRQAVEEYADLAVEVVNSFLDPIITRLRDGATVDIAPTFRMIPTHFMARLLGVPKQDCNQFVEWAQQMSAVYDLFISDPENADELRAAAAAAAATKAMSEYSGAALAQRERDGDTGDLLSAIALTDVEISDQDKCASITLLIFGGQDTTESWTKNAVTCLGEHPDQRRAVQEDRSLLRQALDEVIRWRPPVSNEVRVVRNDGVAIGGVSLPKGDNVSLVIAAAHREPSRWENVDEFDIFRPEKGNLGFGFGLHNCIGVNIARLVVTTVLNKLLDEVPHYRLVLPADELDYGQSFAIRGPKSVLLSL